MLKRKNRFSSKNSQKNQKNAYDQSYKPFDDTSSVEEDENTSHISSENTMETDTDSETLGDEIPNIMCVLKCSNEDCFCSHANNRRWCSCRYDDASTFAGRICDQGRGLLLLKDMDSIFQCERSDDCSEIVWKLFCRNRKEVLKIILELCNLKSNSIYDKIDEIYEKKDKEKEWRKYHAYCEDDSNDPNYPYYDIAICFLRTSQQDPQFRRFVKSSDLEQFFHDEKCI